MIKKRIDNWFVHFKKYFFTYKNGFFELNYLANSPQTLIESADKMPFTKLDYKNQIVTTDNSFLKGEMHYQELEEGLYAIIADLYYKTNVTFKLIYDKYLPIDWYILSYHLEDNKLFIDHYKTDAGLANKIWHLFKPEAKDSDGHLKGKHVTYAMAYFTESWLQKNVFSDIRLYNNFKSFFSSSDKSYMVIDYSDEINSGFLKIMESMKIKGEQGVANIFELKILVYNFIQDFFLNVGKNNELVSSLPKGDLLRLLKVEGFLMEHLEGKFVGIEFLSKKFKISSSKLKTDFKKSFGQSLLQYFQRKQMLLAKDLIENNDMKISDLAFKFGYANPSKFSKTFVKHIGEVPSYYRKELK